MNTIAEQMKNWEEMELNAVSVDQNWEEEKTVYTFSDGSQVVLQAE